MRATRGSGAPVRAGRARGAKREGSGRGVSRVGPGSPQCPSALSLLPAGPGDPSLSPSCPGGEVAAGKGQSLAPGVAEGLFLFVPISQRRWREEEALPGGSSGSGAERGGAALRSRPREPGTGERGHGAGKPAGKTPTDSTAQRWGGHRPVGADHHG